MWLLAATIPFLGKAATHANTAIYLRKRLAGSTYSVSADHCKIAADGLIVPQGIADVTTGSRSTTELFMQCRHDGTNLPIVMEAASLPA